MKAQEINEKYAKLDMKKTGENIRRLMKEKGYSVSYLQKYLKLSTTQSIYHWFQGRNLPSVDNLYALSALFQVPIDAMLEGNRREKYGFCREVQEERFYLYCQKCLEFSIG